MTISQEWVFLMCFGLLYEVYVGIDFVDGRVAGNDNFHRTSRAGTHHRNSKARSESLRK